MLATEVAQAASLELFIALVLKTEFLPAQNFVLSEHSIQSRTTTNGSAPKSGNNLATENGVVVCCQFVASRIFAGQKVFCVCGTLLTTPLSYAIRAGTSKVGGGRNNRAA